MDLMNPTGRVFGMLTQAEQKEMRDASFINNARIEWCDGGTWQYCSSFEPTRYAYRVILPPKEITTKEALSNIELIIRYIHGDLLDWTLVLEKTKEVQTYLKGKLYKEEL